MGNRIKVLIWGTGDIYRRERSYIKQLEEDGFIEVMALISLENISEKDGYKVIKSGEVFQYDYEYVLIMTEKAEISVLNDASRAGIPGEKIVPYTTGFMKWCSQFSGRIGGVYAETRERQINVINKILTASDKELTDYHWMYRAIAEYGICPEFAGADSDVCLTEYGLLQNAGEFAQFCCFLSGGKQRIKSAIEIGVYKGRSSYFMCALLSRKNPGLEYYCVDLVDRMDSFEMFAAMLPALKKCIPSTSDDFKGKSFDFVFIDADHSYDGSMRDYMNVGRFASKVTAFHDVYGHEYDSQNGGIVRTWAEVCEMTYDRHPHIIFSSRIPKVWGIGCIVWDEKTA